MGKAGADPLTMHGRIHEEYFHLVAMHSYECPQRAIGVAQPEQVIERQEAIDDQGPEEGDVVFGKEVMAGTD